MGEWDEGERRGLGWMDGGVGLEREEGAGLDECGSGKKERGGGGAGWMLEWNERERKGWG